MPYIHWPRCPSSKREKMWAAVNMRQKVSSHGCSYQCHYELYSLGSWVNAVICSFFLHVMNSTRHSFMQEKCRKGPPRYNSCAQVRLNSEVMRMMLRYQYLWPDIGGTGSWVCHMLPSQYPHMAPYQAGMESSPCIMLLDPLASQYPVTTGVTVVVCLVHCNIVDVSSPNP
jgi:hypothetical protein